MFVGNELLAAADAGVGVAGRNTSPKKKQKTFGSSSFLIFVFFFICVVVVVVVVLLFHGRDKTDNAVRSFPLLGA